MALTYQKTGVDYRLMDPFKNYCLKIGGSKSQIISLKNHYLVDVLEAVGSLTQLAEDLYRKTGKNYFYQAGWANAASILNDLSVTGATPLTIKLFIATGSASWFKDKKRWQRLIKGFADGAKLASASWNGGETQTLIGMVNTKSTVLAGSATGIIQPKSRFINENKLETNNRIIILASSGIHTNGISLVREIFKNDTHIMAEAIKNKTIIYSPLISEILSRNIKLHYASHITGHGWRKIMRSKRSFTYVIEKLPQVQPIFKKIQNKTGMSNQQMYSDYNMGAGFVLFTGKQDVGKILQICQKLGYQALEAGYIKEGPRKVIIKPLNIKFGTTSLQIL